MSRQGLASRLAAVVPTLGLAVWPFVVLNECIDRLLAEHAAAKATRSDRWIDSPTPTALLA